MRIKIRKLNKKPIFIFPLLVCIVISCGEETEISQRKIEYKIQNYRIVSDDCDTSGRCAYVEFVYPVFSGPVNAASVQILNSYISTALMADDYADSAVSSIDELGNKFIREYENFITEFTDYSIGWALERKIKVIHQHSNVISLEFYEYSFMGGAHPNTVKTYQSFYITTGDKVVIDNSSILDKLTAIAEKEFRRIKNIPEDQNLSDAGYWFENDEFYLNDNFAITDEGIVFYFNPYEIAPYALGPTKLILTRDKVGSLISEIISN